MKYVLTIIINVIIMNTYGQTNTIDVSEINLCRKDNAQDMLPIYSSMELAKMRLGNPQKNFVQHNEMDNTNEQVFEYPGGTKLYFEKNRLVAFEIPEFSLSTITIGKNGHCVRSTQDLNRLYSNIPTDPNPERGPSYDLIKQSKSASLKRDGVAFDSAIFISYNELDPGKSRGASSGRAGNRQTIRTIYLSN